MTEKGARHEAHASHRQSSPARAEEDDDGEDGEEAENEEEASDDDEAAEEEENVGAGDDGIEDRVDEDGFCGCCG